MTITDLLSRFQKVEKVKKGGQKTVYKAQDYQGNNVALKIISNATDQRVIQEIEIVKRIKIPNVPTIIENGIVADEMVGEDALYIIEEFLDGVSLRDWINSGNTADLSFAYNILETLLNTEMQLEQNQILHRDINPNNIIIGNNGTIYLIDFGLAKQMGGLSLTQTGAANGPFTPGYAPYEQFANIKTAQDVRTDLFQIGVTVYECITGRNPFIMPNDTIMQVMSRTMTMVPASISIQGDTKGFFSMLINMLIAKNQSQRPDTAADAVRYLQAIRSTLMIGG